MIATIDKNFKRLYLLTGLAALAATLGACKNDDNSLITRTASQPTHVAMVIDVEYVVDENNRIMKTGNQTTLIEVRHEYDTDQRSATLREGAANLYW